MLIFYLTPLKSSCTNKIYDCIVGTEAQFVVADILYAVNTIFSNAVHFLGGGKNQTTFELSQNVFLFWLRYVYSAPHLRSVLLNVV